MFRKLLDFIGFGHEDKAGLAHRKIGVLLVLTGISIVSPSFKDGLLSFLNQRFQLHLNLDAPLSLGVCLIILGILVYAFGEWNEHRGTHFVGTFIAVRHQSFAPLVGLLTQNMLPARFKKYEIRHLECDQSAFFTGTDFDPGGAVRQQLRLASDLVAVRRTNPDASIGYYGIVHIPLQFLAGCEVSTWPQVALFEHSRQSGQWREIVESGPDLAITVNEIDQSKNPAAVAVRISVSYEVPLSEIAKVVPEPFEDIRLGIAQPRIDAIGAINQIEAFCKAFRKVLDDVHARGNAAAKVHVFYAGPVSLGFSLGRQVSRNIHNRVVVYNYTTSTNPAYAWGLEINGDNQPQTMIVIPSATKP